MIKKQEIINIKNNKIKKQQLLQKLMINQFNNPKIYTIILKVLRIKFKN